MFPFRRSLNWLIRFRHRCGYGIHSPFAFNFVTGVVYEKGEYYAYAQLEKHHAHRSPSLRRKDLRLLFRLANYQRPTHALLFGIPTDNPLQSYLQAGSRHTQWHTHTDDTAPSTVDMIIADAAWPEATDLLLSHLAEGGMLVVINLWPNRQRQAWKQLLSHPNSTIAFDLRDFGIVFHRPDLNRQHYKVCYF